VLFSLSGNDKSRRILLFSRWLQGYCGRKGQVGAGLCGKVSQTHKHPWRVNFGPLIRIIGRFTENEVILNGGRPRKFDLVVMATGFSNTIDSISRTLGPEIASRTSAVWGVDEEGELRGAWRPSGVKGLWIMVGT
jgi:hypothetical protein